jgi:hypothetical protein
MRNSRRASAIVAIVCGSLLLLLVIFILLGLIFPQDTKDGTEKYSGTQQTIAQKALAFSRTNYGPTILPSHFRVTNVESASTDGICNKSFGDPTTASNAKLKARYTVHVEELGIWGIVTKSFDIHECEY